MGPRGTEEAKQMKKERGMNDTKHGKSRFPLMWPPWVRHSGIPLLSPATAQVPVLLPGAGCVLLLQKHPIARLCSSKYLLAFRLASWKGRLGNLQGAYIWIYTRKELCS
ncbi:hypothetical protein KQX54_003410 [Cotesia glomerata]|uniref:Uncharacterized protein n=1 Tax=Cotesia glomerata TaxID=32391 RepID=A0AAV7IJ91_COTGL|nr:hypothetical protein KQX54_003410 [Cotesia glomerata]